MGDADFVYPPLRPGSGGASHSNPEWAVMGQVSEGEDGRKTSDVGERDRVEVFCGKCGHDAGMTNCFRHTKAKDLSHASCVSEISVRCAL